MTFQVTIMFGLGFITFLAAIFGFVGFFYYDRLIGILFMDFWQLFRIGNLDFRIQTSNFRDEKSPLRFCTFI